MKFEKMHGLGNDFILMKDFQRNYPDLAKRLCDRRFGIGADGLVIYSSCKNSNINADYQMRIYNSDGSEAEMCGNAIRCLAKYLAKTEETDGKRLAIATTAGIKRVEIVENFDLMGEINLSGMVGSQEQLVKVNMEKPLLKSSDIPLAVKNDRNDIARQRPIDTPYGIYYLTEVSTGPPHAVIFVQNLLPEEQLLELGPIIEKHDLFPYGTNVEFVKVESSNHLRVQVWERGAGKTLACGTGACAVVVAATINGFCNGMAYVELPGGKLFINWDNNTEELYMIGPAEHVYSGELNNQIFY
ncbi:diaminopimelate epimerase [Natranaerobius thermophilus]|uniref:Diaminopimelate epimerase n=1 Tax=Natranaerobius thermophilus (strain ATCC BAA-1301 / DSM 18059 / JW/NM-WN-LF) TaxID=457570 RepID=DAPF_NATTJ|nr:diaminopimelate epimerase [Natranaerobius thermophilus]B2A663.1 RecName: Full=Diaminopimelate epimerase; Short=DAP epimerase; AltName: Full=PLP-independent amino acid racemase [Natranaerobius thermophilus JW/NM-WN-LF]ACB85484.1 Diaminopimelate epimerase [Natranaerobius thermophilus JW/NM-WN-LF]